ncbi:MULTISPECIES: TonB-dependent siderophore receptor [Acinetobacter]|uniref:TonB-dependent siderophore receptor n=1 Tax=Acinetobacter corruptisaponis TaxID=3045147 RepID=A0ABY8S798_9GAMM|nr:TonB-dependent siderophore receptor [Acinetobacter sp. KCTC 92772]WHP07435.1 TonB-dependent siderophore receptor [Acinetobacter sp. KCTC 92772]
MHHYPTGAFKAHPLMLAMAMLLPSFVYAETNENAQLPTITVKAADENQEKKAYTVKKTTTAVPLGLSVKETPQSVSVVTEQRMKDQGLTSLIDVADNVTGINVQRYETNRSSLHARGFQIDNYQIDGVPTRYDQPWSSGETVTSTALFDRVDVVRGATGLMTGPGNPSAAINMIRKRATSKVPTANLEVSGGSWNNYRVMGDIANSLNESGALRGRAVAQYEQGDSYIDLLKKQALTTLVTGETDIAENTVLSAGVSYQENKTDSPMWGGLPVWYSDGTRTKWNRSKTTSANWAQWDSDYTNLFADVTHSFNDNWNAKLSYSRGDRNGDSKLLFLSGYPDSNTGLGSGAFAGSYKVNTTQDDVSLQVNGKFGLWGQQHELTLGYLYSKQDFNADSRTADFGCGCVPSVGNFNRWNGNYPTPTWSATSFYETSNSKQNAAYVATRWTIIDPLKFILGGRLTDFEKTGAVVYTPGSYQLKYNNEFTPYVGVVYDINKSISAYASYTNIFQPQAEKDVKGTVLDPIEGNSTEIGIKSGWFDGKLNGTLALFQIQQDNLAQQAGIHENKEVYYRAAKGTESKGFEVELTGEILPSWKVTAGYSQFKATDVNGDDVNSELPRKLVQTFTTYQLPGKLNALTVGGGVNWQSSTYVMAGNPLGVSEKVEQDAYALVNLMARYQLTKDFSAQLNINNLFDKEYYGIFPAYGQTTWGTPRNATLTLRYQF